MGEEIAKRKLVTIINNYVQNKQNKLQSLTMYQNLMTTNRKGQ